MTIEELYIWAKEHGYENRQIVVPEPLTSEYEEKILKVEDISIPSDAELAKRFYGTDYAILLG